MSHFWRHNGGSLRPLPQFRRSCSPSRAASGRRRVRVRRRERRRPAAVPVWRCARDVNRRGPLKHRRTSTSESPAPDATENGIGRHESCDADQQLTSQAMAQFREAPTLVVVQTQPFPPKGAFSTHGSLPGETRSRPPVHAGASRTALLRQAETKTPVQSTSELVEPYVGHRGILLTRDIPASFAAA
jgi:hypothetical protein